MNIGIRIVGIIMIISLVVISCTQKDNLVGTGGSGGPTPLNTIIDHNSFTEIYSYEDSCSYNNSSTMIIGNYEEETSYGLLRFTSLPDTSVEITSVNISLEIKDRHDFDIVDNTTLKLAKINDIEWYENATWWTSSDSTDWNNGEHFSETDFTDFWPGVYEIECEEDSINIIFSDTTILEDWINEDVNSGLVIYSDTNGFLEIYASEYSDDKNPILTFEYRETDEDTLTTKTITTCYDCTIYETDHNYTKFENELKISNIQPINIFTKFDVPDSLFLDGYTIVDGKVMPYDIPVATFLQRFTINRAELVLNNDGVNAYPLGGSIYLSPYFVISDTINTDIPDIPLLTNDDIDDLYISSSTDTLQSEHIAVNITKVIQYYISGEYENKGIILRSLNINDNFIHTEFDLLPEIRITFTPPYLEE